MKTRKVFDMNVNGVSMVVTKSDEKQNPYRVYVVRWTYVGTRGANRRKQLERYQDMESCLHYILQYYREHAQGE